MRVGHNPQRTKSLNKQNYLHRIIIPVYIPNSNEEYFKHAFEVLQLCINSLLSSIHTKTFITIIDNACNSEIENYLNELLAQNKIQQLVRYNTNQGKVDPVVSIMKGALEPLITISDADVLFKKGWQKSVEEVFVNIPHVGMVSPVAQPGMLRYYTVWSWYFGFKKNCFVKQAIDDREALTKLKYSLGQDAQFSEIEECPIAIKFNGVKAIIGSGHFCATYHKAVIPFIPNYSSGNQFLNAEEMFLDKPVEDAGFMRLATNFGWVYHIGNVPENWMKEVVLENIEDNKKVEPNSAVENINIRSLKNNFFTKKKILYKIIRSKRFKDLVFKKAKK